MRNESFFQTKEERRIFYKTFASLVIPIAIQNLFTNAVNSADVVMLGYVGQSELSAVSLANQYIFLLIGLLFGIESGITIMASQYWGKKDTDAIQAIMGIALKIVLVIAILISVCAVLVPEQMMRVYTSDETLVAIGATYLRILSASYVLMVVSQVYQSILRSMERAVYATVISSSALILNVVLNAVFIFGLLGAPKLGVIGVAVATVASRGVEFALCVADYVMGQNLKPRYDLIIKNHTLLFRDFLKYSIPALINDVSWTVAFSMYSVILGHMNADIVAANSVSTTVRDLATILIFALTSGTSVMLGVRIGEQRLERAAKEAALFCRITLIAGIVTGVILLITRPFVVGFFTLTERAQSYLNLMLIMNSYYVIGQAMNTLMIASIFRSGGKTRWGMWCDIITMWCVSVPLGFLCAFVLKLPPMVVYFILCLDEFWKMPFVIRYYKSGKWLQNITRDDLVL